MENLSAVFPSLIDRVAVVTGGASGIGEAIVEAFTAQGAKTCFLDVQDDAAEALKDRLKGSRNLPDYYHVNLTDIRSLQTVIRSIGERYGAIDVLVNNAGNDNRHTISEVTEEFWDYTMAVNLKHQFFAAQSVVPFMKKAGRGSIINMSSIGWLIPSTNQCVYVTAKAAIVGLTRTLAHELGDDHIRVNAVLPGAVETERQRRLWLTEEYIANVLANQALKRMIQPQEIAQLVMFLAADDSSAITNQMHVIDAGWV